MALHRAGSTGGQEFFDAPLGQPLMSARDRGFSDLPFLADDQVSKRIQLQGIEDYDSGGRTTMAFGGVKYYDDQAPLTLPFPHHDTPAVRCSTITHQGFARA